MDKWVSMFPVSQEEDLKAKMEIFWGLKRIFWGNFTGIFQFSSDGNFQLDIMSINFHSQHQSGSNDV